MKYRLILLFSIILISCGTVNPPLPRFLTNAEVTLENLRLPEGFNIEIYANEVKNARSMELLPNGNLVVGTRDEGKVYLLKDIDQDNRIDEVLVLAEKLKMPNGVAFKVKSRASSVITSFPCRRPFLLEALVALPLESQ